LSALKQLASQTAVYGISSILGRVFNYLLTPLYTYSFVQEKYGEVSEMYAYVAFFIVFLTFGMETAFFKFSSTEDNKTKVYNTAFTSVIFTSVTFILFGLVFTQSIADFIGYATRPDFVIYFALILGIDAFCSIPLASLRQENKAKRFAIINLTNIGTTIFFNLLFIAFAKTNYDNENHTALVDFLYNPAIGVAYVFIANLLASIVKLLMLYPEVIKLRWEFDTKLLKVMVIYSFPIMIAGFAGIINETFDRLLIRRMIEPESGTVFAKEQVAIYSGVYKLAILISLFIQAFRYAAEPFFFAHAKQKDGKLIYARVMNYFVLAVSIMFLFVLFYLDILKYFLPPSYWSGLKIVPILLFANIFLGIYYNQSIWYKLTGQTKYGAFIAIGGAVLTIGLNVLLIPILGYVASAWTTFIVYAGMMIASYILGQKHYPIPYNLKKVGFYLVFALVLYGVSLAFKYFLPDSLGITLGFNTLLFGFYLWFIYNLEGINLKEILKKSN